MTFIRRLIPHKAPPAPAVSLIHESIDTLPIYNWNKISSENNLKWLFIDAAKTEGVTPEKLQQTWEIIYAEYIDTFGIPERMLKILQLRGQIHVKRMDLFLTGNRTNELFIARMEKELAELLKEPEQSSKQQMTDVSGYVEKFMGFQLNENTTTVKKFYGYLKMLEADAKMRLAHAQ